MVGLVFQMLKVEDVLVSGFELDDLRLLVGGCVGCKGRTWLFIEELV